MVVSEAATWNAKSLVDTSKASVDVIEYFDDFPGAVVRAWVRVGYGFDSRHG